MAQIVATLNFLAISRDRDHDAQGRQIIAYTAGNYGEEVRGDPCRRGGRILYSLRSGRRPSAGHLGAGAHSEVMQTTSR